MFQNWKNKRAKKQAEKRFDSYEKLLVDLDLMRGTFARSSEIEDLIFEWFERNVQYKTESKDVWYSLDETLSKGYGDCEDFCIGYYETYLRLGYPDTDMKFHMGTVPGIGGHCVFESPSKRILDNRKGVSLFTGLSKKNRFSLSTKGLYIGSTFLQPRNEFNKWFRLKMQWSTEGKEYQSLIPVGQNHGS